MDIDGINWTVNENKDKRRIVIFFSKTQKKGQWLEWIDAVGWLCDFRERMSSFSLDFRPFEPSVLDGARSKVDLQGESYAWTPIWWSSDNSKR